jgi:transcription antitermination factor NusG
MEELEYQWYVVRAISGQEKKVKANIESELEKARLMDFVPEILIPLEKVYQIKNGKKLPRTGIISQVIFLLKRIYREKLHLRLPSPPCPRRSRIVARRAKRLAAADRPHPRLHPRPASRSAM